MKRLWLVALCTVFLLLVSCAAPETKKVATSDEDLPPEPTGPPGTGAGAGGEDIVGQAYKGEKVEGYAPPVDVYIPGEQQIVFVEPEVINRELEDLDDQGRAKPEPVTLRVEFVNKSVMGLVYKQYGYYDARQKKWEMKEFPQQAVGGSKWIRTKAEAELVFPDAAKGIAYELPDGLNYFAVYFCRKHEGVWRCGWDAPHNQGGKGGMWGLITLFKRNVLFPPSPLPPGKVVSKRAWLTPTQRIFAEGNKVGVGVNLQSKQQDLTADVVSVDIKDAAGKVVHSVDAKAVDDHQICDAQVSADERDLFGCKRSYGGEVDVSAAGEYTVTLKGASDDTVVEEGSFKVFRADVIDAEVIRADTGGKKFRGVEVEYSDQFEIYTVGYLGSWVEVGIIKDLTPKRQRSAGALEDLRRDHKTGDIQLIEVVDGKGVKHTVYYGYTEWKSAVRYRYRWFTKDNERFVVVEYQGDSTDGSLASDEGVVAAYLEKHPSALTGETEVKKVPKLGGGGATEMQCEDGVDNDGDDLIDVDDAGCLNDDGEYDASFNDENADAADVVDTECSDGEDNDDDGDMDEDDAGCLDDDGEYDDTLDDESAG